MATFIDGHLHIDLSITPYDPSTTTTLKQDATITTDTTSTPRDLSAVTAVLNTTELLELILLELPIIDILTCTQISNFFLDLIESSKAIRTHLLHPDTPMYTILSYGKHIPIPNSWLHRTSLAAGNLKRTHFIMDLDRGGKILVYDSGRDAEQVVYAFFPIDGNFVNVLKMVEDYRSATAYSVYWKDEEGNVVCFRDFDASWTNEDPDHVIRDYFLGVQERRRESIDTGVLSSGNIRARTSKRKAIVRALHVLRCAVRARRSSKVYVGVSPCS